MKPRTQCKACPWRKDVNPERDIPGGYCVLKHAKLQDTIAPRIEDQLPGLLGSGPSAPSDGLPRVTG